jgi:hypothetical protein
MRRRAWFAACVLTVAAATACSDDETTNDVVLDEACGEVTVSAPSTVPSRPQFCAVGRYLTTDEEQDLGADYVTIAVAWRGAEGFTFVVTAGPPVVDNVFDLGRSVRVGIERTDDSCAAAPPALGFTSTARNGVCHIEQKVALGTGPTTFAIEVRDGDTVVDTLTVAIPLTGT